MKLMVGVYHPYGCSLHYVPLKDIGWYDVFTTKTKGDGIHCRVEWVDAYKTPFKPRKSNGQGLSLRTE